jgi:hypothetical protein
MNKYDIEYARIMRKMERGGSIDSYSFQIETPTGVKSKLTYVQQVLVRTTKFKEWFGDWENAARIFLEFGYEDPQVELIISAINKIIQDEPKYKNVYLLNSHLAGLRSYKDVSKAIDMETLEPMVLYHGTRAEEFYEFKTEVTGTSRPYAYFAFNRSYSENFSQWDGGRIYDVFVNAKKPFSMIFHSRTKDTIRKDVEDFINIRYKSQTGEDLDLQNNKIVRDFFQYYDRVFDSSQDLRFWMIMARDIDGVFKKMLEFLDFDSVLYGEEISLGADGFDPSTFTQAFTIFYANQVKLADGRNTDFNPFTNDIRYEDGGATEKPIMLPDMSTKFAHLKSVLNTQGYNIEPMERFEVGGTVKHEKGATTDGKKGGYFEGRSHADGGIKAFNVSTQTPIEVEGGEVIITKKAVDDDDLKEFEGEMLTNREILSRINQSGGGVAFEDGGEIHSCNCTGNKFAYGGETLEDYEIIRRLQSSYDSKNTMKNKNIKYGHNLMRKMKQGGFI